MAKEFNILTSAVEAIKEMAAAREQIEQQLNKAMEKALLTIEADAKKNCPVDEGRLRASITHAIDQDGYEVKGRVGTNVDYAPYVHNGTGIYALDGNGRKTPWVFEGQSVKWKGKHFTRGTKAKPFLQEAIDENRDKIGEIFKEAVDEI